MLDVWSIIVDSAGMETNTLPAWSVHSLPIIENPNSSGQGYCASHRAGALSAVCLPAGYSYSHSVPVCNGATKRIVHCFKFHVGAKEEHNVSFCDAVCDTSQSWSTSVSCASGHKSHGFGPSALARHLKNKARRYKLSRSVLL